jgi:hypothetical protein
MRTDDTTPQRSMHATCEAARGVLIRSVVHADSATPFLSHPSFNLEGLTHRA